MHSTVNVEVNKVPNRGILKRFRLKRFRLCYRQGLNQSESKVES